MLPPSRLGDTACSSFRAAASGPVLIGEAGRGVVVLIREPNQRRLSERVGARLGEVPPVSSGELREYGVGAQILLDLGVRDMVLLSNTPKTIVGLEGFGLRVVDRRPIVPDED